MTSELDDSNCRWRIGMADSKTTPSQKTAGDVKPGAAATSAENPAPAKTHSAAREPAAALVETSAQTKAISALSPRGGTAIGETVGSTLSKPPLTDPVAQKPVVATAPVIHAEKPKGNRSTEKHFKPDATEIEHMIAEAAYYLAEKRSFAPGFEGEDWAVATAEVMARLR